MGTRQRRGWRSGKGGRWVRGVDGTHAGAAETGDARLLGGTSVGGARLLRAVMWAFGVRASSPLPCTTSLDIQK